MYDLVLKVVFGNLELMEQTESVRWCWRKIGLFIRRGITTRERRCRVFLITAEYVLGFGIWIVLDD